MSYLAFALKYRPTHFDEVVGQAHIVAALKKAIATDHIHHAYLFSGPRGVGKTSLARIMSRSLNCVQGPTVRPCGKCPVCVEIDRGSCLDVIEIDGASNRGIDEVRSLRENVKLVPAQARYKIYIIDEVHMLTQEAFNALLKTLEEPPRHVKFIFATTHPQKMLPTIVSRCQKFHFHLLPAETIVDKLKSIAVSENLDIEETVLYSLARSSGGSLRDAESFLDQLAPIFMEKGVSADIMSFLGIIDEHSLNQLVELIINRQLSDILSFINSLVKQGKDLGVFVNNFIEHLRNLLLVTLSPKAFKELVYVSPQTKDFLVSRAKLIPVSKVLRLIDLFIQSKEQARKLNSIRIPFELAIIKFCRPEDKDGESRDNHSRSKTSAARGGASNTGVDKKTVKPVRPVKKSFPPAGSVRNPMDKPGVSSPSSVSAPPKPVVTRSPDISDPVPEKNPPVNKSKSLEKEKNNDFDQDFWQSLELDLGEERLSQTENMDAESGDMDPMPVNGTGEEKDFLEIKNNWQKFLTYLGKEKVSIAAYLREARLNFSGKGWITLCFPRKFSFHKETLEKEKTRKFIEESIAVFFKCSFNLKFDLSGQEAGEDSPAMDNYTAQEDPMVDELMDTFEGMFDF